MVSQGTCDERFAGVRAAFEKNLDQDDVGASVAVTVDGDFVVDLWGDTATPPAPSRGWRTPSSTCFPRPRP